MLGANGAVLLLLVSVPGLVTGTTVRGFEFIDKLSEEYSAGDNVVEIETPFSSQFSLCLWINPTWAKRGSGKALYYENFLYTLISDHYLNYLRIYQMQ